MLVGPVVTRYELELQPGVKASKVTSIDIDLARALMFRSIRVAEVIPGKPILVLKPQIFIVKWCHYVMY